MTAPSNSTLQSPFFRAFSNHLVYDVIFGELNAGERFRCSRASRLLYVAVQDFHHRAYNINRRLRQYFTDPVSFRSLQAQTGTLISGSTALQFLDGTFYPGSDLDLYVFEAHAREVGCYLRDREHYRFVPSTWQDSVFETAETLGQLPGNQINAEHYRSKAISAVYTFKRAVVDRDGELQELKVQVIAASRCPLWTILCFHSTAVMNFITYNAAYSLYPRAMFKERQSLVMSAASTQDRHALAKYADRGWRMIGHIFPHRQLELEPFYPRAMRWIEDRFSWVVPLDTDGLEGRGRRSPTSEVVTFDPADCSSWRLRINWRNLHRDPNQSPCSMVTNHVPRSGILQYMYLVADRRLLRYLLEFIEIQANVEEMKASGWHPGNREQIWTWWDAELKRIIDRYRDDPNWLWEYQGVGNAMEVD